MNREQIARWRLILGKAVESEFNSEEYRLSEKQQGMDSALGAIYDNQLGQGQGGKKGQGGLKKSAPSIARWLGSLREYFDAETVAMVQKDAIERKGLKELLYEPEILKEVEPDIHLITALLSLKDQVPEESKNEVRSLITRYVEELQIAMRSKIEEQVRGQLNRRKSSVVPRYDSINWRKTVQYNLKNCDPETKQIFPEKIFYFGHKKKTSNWQIIIDIDQSASMAESMIYAAVMGSIFASIPATNTRVVAFDTEVVDLTEECGNDPVGMLYGMQLGGGTDINKSIIYCRDFIDEPSKSIFILISDLFEGGNRQQMVTQLKEIKQSGTQVVCLLTLSNEGLPFYDELIAKELRALEIPCFGCSPDKLPELIKEVLAGNF